MTELARIASSDWDLIYPRGDGSLRYENREYRLIRNRTPSVSLVDTAVLTMDPVQDTERVINRAETVAHPRRVDADYSVLFSLQDRPLIAPGQPLTIHLRRRLG